MLGSEDSILGFKGLGVDTVGLTNKTAETALRNMLSSGEYAIIFITEDWYPKLEKQLKDLANQALPAIVSVPGPKGSTGQALKNLSKLVEQAVGSDILN